VDQARDAAAAKTAGRFVLGFALGIAHEALIEGFFCADVIVVVKSQFAALAALQIFCHETSLRRSVIDRPAGSLAAAIRITALLAWRKEYSGSPSRSTTRPGAVENSLILVHGIFTGLVIAGFRLVPNH
jgi:hypothetical protein